MKRAAVVIGAGVDALVAAHYLARGGYHVTLVQGRAQADEHAWVQGWVPPRIAADLHLERHGLRLVRPDPWTIVMPEDTGLELTADVAASAQSIRKLSAADAGRWPAFCAQMRANAKLLESLYVEPPPDPLNDTMRGKLDLLRAGLRVRRLGRRGMTDFLRILPMSVADLLDEWFENDALKGVLGAAGVMNLRQGPRSGGTAFNFLHHHVGSAEGVFRPPLSNVCAALTRRPGIEISAATVRGIDTTAGRVTGVVLDDGSTLAAATVVSALPPARTLLELADPGWLDPDLVRAIQHVRSRGASARIVLMLDREPRFTTLVIAPSLDYLERAYDDVKYERVSSAPFIEARYLGADAADRHRVELHVQYVPRKPAGLVWDTAQSEKFARAMLACVSHAVPGFERWVIEQHVLTPDDLEHLDGFPEGQPYHAELALDQVLWMRPTPRLARYRTPIEGLYLCGPSMHPGAGVAGAAGANAAAVVLGRA
jgi:phytoene dehydrogenase-like protein